MFVDGWRIVMHHGQLKHGFYRMRDALPRLGCMAAMDTNWRIIEVSDGFRELFGYLEGSSHELTFDDTQHGEDMPAFYRRIRNTVHKGNVWQGDVPVRQGSGDLVLARLSISPSFHEGEIAGYIAQWQRVHTNNALHGGLNDMFYRYRSGFNRIAAMAIVSLEGEIQDINSLFVTLYGHSRSEIIGKNIRILRSGQTASSIYRELWETVLKGETWTGEVINKCKDGTCVHVRSLITPAPPENNECAQDYAFLVIYQDIDAEIEARDLKARLEAESAKQTFLAGALHNIGNLQQSVQTAYETSSNLAKSLIAVCQQVNTHLDTLPAEQQKEFARSALAIILQTAEQIDKAATTGGEATRSTLSVLHGFRQQQKNIMITEAGSVANLMQRIMATFSLRAAQDNIKLTVSALPEDSSIQWPMDRAYQIIFNLLKNAEEEIIKRVKAKELRHGHIDIEVRPISREGQSRLTVSIKDNGGGFSVTPEKLFEHGFSTKTTGTGLGLHNSSALAKSLGGEIYAENVEWSSGKGAKFTLCLPRHIASRPGHTEA